MVHYLLTDLFQDLDDVNIDGRDLMDAIARRHDTIIAMLVAVTHVTVGDDCVIQVAASGNVALLQTLVTATTIRLADRHVTAETALRRATANGHTDMMEYLLTDLFQGIETTHLSSADVQAAVANGHEATLTSLFHGTHVTVDHDCVINVAGTGNLTLLQTLVTTTTINIDDRHAVASMAVGRAAASGHTDMVHYLLAELFHDVKCVAIAAGDLMAIASRHVPTLSMLVDATHVTVDDDCVIQVAAVGNVALLQTLVTAATIRLADGQATAGRALGHAAVGRHQAMVQYLLSDFFSNVHEVAIPDDVLEATSSFECLAQIVHAKDLVVSDLPRELDFPVRDDVAALDAKDLQSAVARGPDMLVQIAAAGDNQVGILNQLVTALQPLMQPHERQRTWLRMLMHAASKGNQTVVRYLLLLFQVNESHRVACDALDATDDEMGPSPRRGVWRHLLAMAIAKDHRPLPHLTTFANMVFAEWVTLLLQEEINVAANAVRVYLAKKHKEASTHWLVSNA
ncbi:Aste57867_6876 [Aphanomyces stellatus]|uniref:Aste57867_6876 protein n=1 Tax=Aphanomyces stellatus TaxID=120398 RepID=A0A485KG52_9STRA|nr:hypothetical protein As57867_006855 [Aphanomyces stellatus]VFT83833.1 Aste57867_6876 [Aphanomyces stellatus]